MEQNAVSPTKVVSRRVREFRILRKMSAQQLADRCAAAGLPGLARQVITNLENGRRGAVSIEEVLTLAYVLDVPPVLLFLPTGPGDRVAVTPNTTMHPYEAYLWAAGRRPALNTAAVPLQVYTQIAESADMVDMAAAGRVYGPDGNPDPDRARTLYGQHLAGLAQNLELAAEFGIAVPPMPAAWIADMRARGLLRNPEHITVRED
jgi:transcriptional regulator with XRE-family HTH domain